MSVTIWWVAVAAWAVGFTLSMTKAKAVWAPVSYLTGCALLIASAFTDPKIDTTTAWVIAGVLFACMVGIGWSAMTIERHRCEHVEDKEESCSCGQWCHGKRREESDAE